MTGAVSCGWAGDPGFHDLIPIRIPVVDPAVHYHIPLLLSPYSYPTHRGICARRRITNLSLSPPVINRALS
jgi:hypothetical protein